MSLRASVERHRWLLDFALASLARRKGRNVALLGVQAVVVFALASVLLFTRALREEARAVLGGAPALLVQRTVAGRHDLAPEGWVAGVAGIRGVERARGRLWGYYFDAVSGANFTVLVPERFWGARGEAAIGAGVARARGLGPGDSLSLVRSDGSFATLAVREVAPGESELVTSDLVVVGEEDFRALFGIAPGLYTDVAAEVRNPREVATVARKVAQALPGARPITRAEILRTWDSIFDWRSGLAVLVLTGAVLALGIVAWDRAAGLSADEQREIGILKAIGWETSDVLVLKAWEGAVVSTSAFALGALAAWVHVFHGKLLLFGPLLRGWATFPPDIRLVPAASVGELLTLFLLTVVPVAAAAVVPTWRAATADPDRVMRGLG